MVEHGPLALAVGSSLQEYLEGIVPRNPHAPGMAQQVIQLGYPLRMRGLAKAEPKTKQTVPVFPEPLVLPPSQAFSPKVAAASLAMPVMSVPPKPGCQGLVLVRFSPPARHTLVDLSLRGKQSIEGRDRQFSRIPGMVGTELRIAYLGNDGLDRAGKKQNDAVDMKFHICSQARPQEILTAKGTRTIGRNFHS